MIINLRGTHGSGKSTIVRRLMAAYPSRTPQFVPGRRRPIGYLCAGHGRGLWVAGHYETACGGCDTIPSVEMAYDQIRAAAAGHDVIFEGILIGHDVRRCIELHTQHGHPVLVVLLTTTLAECLAAARARRVARGDTRELTAANFRQEWTTNSVARMRTGGLNVCFAAREEAFAACHRALELPGHPADVPYAADAQALQPEAVDPAGQLGLLFP